MIVINVTRSREHNSDGRITGEVAIDSTAPGSTGHIHEAQFNFSSTVVRDKLAKTLAGRAPDVAWEDIINQLCYMVVRIVRRGEPVETIRTTDEIHPPEYLLYPIIPRFEHTVIYGDGASFKSGFALALNILIALPWQDNPLGLKTLTEPSKVLFLDWETNPNIVRWNLKRLQRGMDLPELIEMEYRRCSRPLADDIEQIQDWVTKTGATVLIVDSVGAATAADLNASEPAFRLFNALRSLKTTNILIAHNAKNTDRRNTSVYGNVYYMNEPRSVWELKRTQEVDEDTIALGLYPKKYNLSKKFPDLGFQVSFTDETINISKCDPKNFRELLDNMSNQTRIIELLKDEGKLTHQEIAGALEIKENVVRVKLYEMRAKGIVSRFEDKKWGLVSDE